MPQRPILRTAKYENLGEKIAKHQRLQWPTYVEGTVVQTKPVQHQPCSNCVGRQLQEEEGGEAARKSALCAFEWLPDPYEYKPLDKGFGVIRLIEVLPGPVDSIIKCTLHHGTLDKDYTCLSYLSSFDKVAINNSHCFISVDKKRVRISKHLWNFLYFARTLNNASLFWIKEVCIDSTNLVEKSHQVSLLPSIYRRATSTIVWLDYAAGEIGNPDLSLINDATDTLQDGNGVLNALWLTSSRTLAIQIFLFHPHWWRLWTAQELALSQNLRFVTSRDECSLEAIYTLFRGLTNVKLELPDLYHAMLCSPAFNILSNIRPLYLKHNGLPLYYLMQALKFYDCAEPRDRIFGVLGLAMHGDGFEVDYSESVPNLIRRAWERFRPRMRWLSKLLFLDLIEALDVDHTMLPFYLSSRWSFPQASTIQIDSDGGKYLRLEIKEKNIGYYEPWARIHTQPCCCLKDCSCGRSKSCTLRCGRQKYVLCPTGMERIRMISCWQA